MDNYSNSRLKFFGDSFVENVFEFLGEGFKEIGNLIKFSAFNSCFCGGISSMIWEILPASQGWKKKVPSDVSKAVFLLSNPFEAVESFYLNFLLWGNKL